jgi:hypothetical protein
MFVGSCWVRHHVREGNNLTQIFEQPGPKMRSGLKGHATLVSQVNDARLASRASHWYGGDGDPARRTGSQDGAGGAGPELAGEVPQTIQEEWNSYSEDERKQIHDHGSVLLNTLPNDEEKGLKKYWINHEDFMKIQPCP